MRKSWKRPLADEVVQRPFETVYDLLPDNSAAAIGSVDHQESSLTFARLRQLMKGIDAVGFGLGEGKRVASLLPNGPFAATAHMVLSSYATHAPLSVSMTLAEIAFELEDLPADILVVLSGYSSSAMPGFLQLAADMGIPVIELVASGNEAGWFNMRWLHQRGATPLAGATNAMRYRPSLSLLVHTSGTTNKPKVVPLTHENVAVDVLINPLCLTPSDLCLNMMPLFHVHGLFNNLVSSLVAGSCTITTPGFDATLALEWLRDHQPTWYGSVPTMHQVHNYWQYSNRPSRAIGRT